MSSTGNSSTAGNIAAGFVDGLIGFPVVEKISNYISPGSVDNCSDAYKYSGYAGFAAGFIIPGGALVKSVSVAGKIGVLASKIGSKVSSSISKRIALMNEDGFILIKFSKKDFDRSKMSDLQEISKLTRKTTNQMNREIRKNGGSISNITRVDNPKEILGHKELPHVTFKKFKDHEVALNIDGSWKHNKGNYKPTNKEIKWLKNMGSYHLKNRNFGDINENFFTKFYGFNVCNIFHIKV